MSNKQHSIGKEKAIQMAESGWWKDKTPRQICDVQFFIRELCMDFSAFHKAVEDALGRPVFTIEFGTSYKGIVAEYLGDKEPPTFDQILALVPSEKLMLAIVD